MDSIKKLLQKNIKLVIFILVFIVIVSGITYSATTYLYESNVVGYDNSNSGLTATDVQSALDELYTKCQSSGGDGYTCYENTDITSAITQGAVSDGIRSTYVNSDTGVNFGAISSDTNGKGVYIRAGTIGTPHPIYYYRGAVTNNNVIFANFCWKIVRTTETGGIKLIYNGIPSSGECINTTGATTRIGQSTFVADNRRADYTYDVSGVETNSAIKNVIDNWYAANMTDYTSYLEDAVWCSDRNGQYYPLPSYERLTNSKSPSLDCVNNDDKYTVSSVNGNGKLTYPVALLTADEIAFAGAVSGTANTTYYLYFYGDPFWSLSPATYLGSPTSQWVGYCTYGSTLYTGTSYLYNAAVRPAVSLKPGTTFAYGNGTAESPYVVATETQNTFNCPPDYECYKKVEPLSIFALNAVSDATSSTYVSSSSGINFGAISSNTNGNGLYLKNGTQLTGHPIYYYRGAVTNNNVLFANFCWKIVRTTETGGIKLVYNGLPSSGRCTNTTGAATQLASTTAYNSSTNNAKYVGYTYDNNGTETNSTIKNEIDNWYGANMTDYTSYLEDTVWCNDRSGTTSAYGGLTRANNHTPSLDCINVSDRYTVSSSNGNGKLIYPVGLLTIDEAMLAGGVWTVANTSFYLYTGLSWYTMSPTSYSGSSAYVSFYSNSTNALTGGGCTQLFGVRPSVSLKPDISFISGDGTANTPYVVATT